MKTKGLFWILSLLMLLPVSVLAWYLLRESSYMLFAAVEGLMVLTVIYLVYYYRRLVKPMQTIGDGMALLDGQDFGSRLRKVGQPEADRIVEVFNRLMAEMKNERLRLREQNYLLDLLVDASPLGVVILDFDGVVFSVNPAGLKLFEASSESEVTGRRLEMIDSMIARELTKVAPHTSQTVALGNGQVYKCTHSSFVDSGFPRSFYLVEPLTEELHRAEKKTYEKVIRMIAHEVNNTIAGLSSSLDSIANSLSDLHEEEELLRIVIERCYAMNRFIAGFADLVRIPEPDLRDENLNLLVSSSILFAENICLERNIRIETNLADEPVHAMIDPILFERVLLNIIKNAAESIDNGGVIYIRTSLLPTSIEIADTGKGIDEEVSGKLFSPFFSTKPYGQGLGLIFVREVLTKHGFGFDLRTGPDGLTRFTISIG